MRSFRDGLPDLSNFYCLPGRAGGSPNGLGHAKYGKYYLSGSRFNYGEEESPALLLLWTKEQDQWRVIAWAVEVP
jgi:hypothetical protein